MAYLTVTEARAYFDNRLNSEAWDYATDEDKRKALETATNKINDLRFLGSKAISSQANEFPRLGQTVVPSLIKDATCELALQLLNGVDPNEEINSTNVLTDKYSQVGSHYNRDFTMAHIRNGIPSSEAWAKLLPYLADPLSFKLARK